MNPCILRRSEADEPCVVLQHAHTLTVAARRNDAPFDGFPIPDCASIDWAYMHIFLQKSMLFL